MDQVSDIYVNMKGPGGNQRRCTMEVKWSENMYHNENNICTLEPDRTGPAPSGAGHVNWSSCRSAAVFLCLLVLLLLTGLTILVVMYTKGNSEWKMKVMLLKTNYKNLTEELNQLKTSYIHLTKERNDLQRKLDQNGRHGWLNFSGSSYFVSSLKKSWKDSRAYCQYSGADLIVINSKEEQEFTRGFPGDAWIGLTDIETEGTWMWVDGTPLTTSFRLWGEGEPNGAQDREEDCAELKHRDLRNDWNDASCDHQNFWICETTSAQ